MAEGTENARMGVVSSQRKRGGENKKGDEKKQELVEKQLSDNQG